MITVEQAETIIQSQIRNYGVEEVDYSVAVGRVLAESLSADRDFPAFNRATVDGIAISFSAIDSGNRSFNIAATQAAGAPPCAVASTDQCIEIMTGAAVDESVDTVIRYEDLELSGTGARLRDIEIIKGANIHLQGADQRKNDVVAGANRIITPAVIGLAGSIGKARLKVKKLPRIIIITTGDELVDIEETPTRYQLRRSNGVTIKAVIARYGTDADMIHLKDDYDLIKSELNRCLQEYDVILMSGGVSMGKFDYVPKVLEELSVKELFHKVKQKPGKPFWFGHHENQTLIFAFPGNPVSVFMCLHRYFIPWLEEVLGLKVHTPEYAILKNEVSAAFPLQFFAQVQLSRDPIGRLSAEVISSNGSGDFSNLIYTDAFMEFPMDSKEFHKGEIFRIWRYII